MEVNIIDRILEGDWTALATLRFLPEEVVVAMAQGSDLKRLKPSAVRHVLLSLAEGDVAPDMAQAWASFVRRGYFEGRGYPSPGFDIEYDESAEMAIADAVGRMDELGDSIDGEIGPDEMRSLIAALASREDATDD